jgi:transcriptional regulator GlxA family with amidase domain
MHRVGFIVPQGFQLMSFAALTAFEIANLPPSGPPYEVHLLSEQGGSVISSGGMRVETEAFGNPAFDTVIVRSITKFDRPRIAATFAKLYPREAAPDCE